MMLFATLLALTAGDFYVHGFHRVAKVFAVLAMLFYVTGGIHRHQEDKRP